MVYGNEKLATTVVVMKGIDSCTHVIPEQSHF